MPVTVQTQPQHTLQGSASLSGKALHTGEVVTLTLKPGKPNTGLVIVRTDMPGAPEIPANVQYVAECVRSTTLRKDGAEAHTVEHVLSALRGCHIDNARIEMDGPEPPIADGSARAYLQLIQEAGGPEAQASSERRVFYLNQAVHVLSPCGTRIAAALPPEPGQRNLRVLCTSADARGVHCQELAMDITPETYAEGIAHARTFTLYEDIEPLLKAGKIKGGSLDAAIVIRAGKVLAKEPLRYADEFVRHKILDIVGDTALLGTPFVATIVATKTGHALNAQLTEKLAAAMAADAAS